MATPLKATAQGLHTDAAEQWLAQLEKASTTNDVDLFVDAFLPFAWLRDLLCFSWNFGASGADKLKEYLSLPPDRASPNASAFATRFQHAGLHSFALDDKSTYQNPRAMDLPGGGQAIQGPFTFAVSNPKGKGRGYFRLIQIPIAFDGPQPIAFAWKAFSVLLSLWDLEGHEESFTNRGDGHVHDPTTGVRRVWEDLEEERKLKIEEDPTVLVVGAGQAGLTSAARLQHLGLRVLVIEKTPRVGDVWRNRYRNLTLHSTSYTNSLLYEPIHQNSFKYFPRMMVANTLEAYASTQNLHIWLNTVLQPQGAAYDHDAKHWNVTVDRTDASGKINTVSLHPKHVVLATGNGIPFVPEFKALKEGVFKGLTLHTSEHKDASLFKGKKVVVIGSANSAADVSEDAYSHGADVTMIQRSPNCLVTSKAAEIIGAPDYAEDNGVPRYALNDYDLFLNSMALPQLLQVASQPEVGITAKFKAIDKELLEGLEKAGYKLQYSIEPGGPEVGPLGFLYHRAAARSLIDVGCAQIIVDGKIKVKSGHGVAELVEDGVALTDGTKIEADIVVFATGYKSHIDSIRDLFAPSVKLPKKVWGIDESGDMEASYRPTPQRGLWFVPGGFMHPRFFTKHMALQILAEEYGIKQV